MLLDKVYKFGDTRIELGGEASNRILLNRTVAAHTTCYEHDSKVLGLKVSPSSQFVNYIYFQDPFFFFFFCMRVFVHSGS